MANLVKSTTDHTTMSYARYLMSVHLSRELSKDEHVDHKNDDKLDDRVENFQLLTPAQNHQKYTAANPKKMFSLICPVCDVAFERYKRQMYGKTNPCCSRACGNIKRRIKP